jgi:hypothetical protein
MLYLALLPLLAMSGTMAGPMMRRGRGYRMPSSLNENNRQLFLDPDTDNKSEGAPRMASLFSSMSHPVFARALS